MTVIGFKHRSIRNILDVVNVYNVVGPDGILPLVFQKCAPENTPVLGKLFSLSIATRSFQNSVFNIHHLPENFNIISDGQYGFRSRDSTSDFYYTTPLKSGLIHVVH